MCVCIHIYTHTYAQVHHDIYMTYMEIYTCIYTHVSCMYINCYAYICIYVPLLFMDQKEGNHVFDFGQNK